MPCPFILDTILSIRKIHWRRDRLFIPVFLGFPGGLAGKESACNVETWAWSLGWEDPLEKGTATHSGILVWRSPWTVVHGVAKSRRQLSGFHLSLSTCFYNTYFYEFTQTFLRCLFCPSPSSWAWRAWQRTRSDFILHQSTLKAEETTAVLPESIQ